MTWDSPKYLKSVQYRDSANLDARTRLHTKYGRSDWYSWLASHVPWKAGGRYLDVGCGTGQFWHDIAPQLPANLELDLVDLSEGMVKVAAKRLREPSILGEGTYARVTARTADAQSMLFGDSVFDGALAVHVLHHLPHPEQGVRELQRVVKPGGVVLCVLNDQHHMRELFELSANVFGDAAVDAGQAIPDFAKAEANFRAHFQHVEVIAYTDDLLCTDPRDVFEYVMSVHQSPEALARVDALSAAIDNAFTKAGGTLRITKDVKVLRCC